MTELTIITSPDAFAVTIDAAEFNASMMARIFRAQMPAGVSLTLTIDRANAGEDALALLTDAQRIFESAGPILISPMLKQLTEAGALSDNQISESINASLEAAIASHAGK